jgi:hypothetical protein
MTSLNPTPVGSSSRLTSLLSTSSDYYVFKNKTDSTKTIQQLSSGPLLSHALSGGNNKSIETNFNGNASAIYKKISPYTHNGTGLLGFGPDQPYVSVNPDSKTKRIKRYDSVGFPIGSTIQDTIRIAKWSVSGKGLLFYGKQFLLQAQAAHNETGIYNPLSVLQATVRPATLGLIPRPKRHIDTGGSFLAGLLGAMGIKDNSGEPPKGTAGAKDRSTLPESGQNNGKGNIRAKTGFDAHQKLLLKYGASTPSKKTGFLSGLIKSLLPSIGTQPDQFKNLTGAHKYRADQDAYDLMLSFHKKQSESHPVLYGNYYSKNYSDSSLTNQGKAAGVMPDGDNMYISSYISSSGNTGLEQLYSDLVAGKFTGKSVFFYNSPLNDNFKYTQGIVGGLPEKIENTGDIDVGTIRKLKANGIQYFASKSAIQYSQLIGGKDQRIGRYEDIIDTNESSNMLIKSKGFSTSYKSDKIGETSVVEGSYFIKKQSNGSIIEGQSDQIPFWFQDIVNDKYIQFRAIISGISDNESVDWEEIRYLGKPESVYNYKGYSRSLSFSFTIAVTSVKELHPTWKKINYLKSMSRPSNYSMGKFMVPPLVNLRMGDIYYNVPIIMQSINITIPDDAIWETLPDGYKTYEYAGGRISIDNVRVGQFPTRVEVSITAYVLEKEKYPRIGSTVFGINEEENKGNFLLREYDTDSILDDGMRNKIYTGPPTTPKPKAKEYIDTPYNFNSTTAAPQPTSPFAVNTSLISNN